jgi:RNA polymerase sigma factor (sigma-70 family)
MDPRRLLSEEWPAVERLIAATCRRRGVEGADADEFATMVKVKLLDNDCEIVRRFRGESKFTSYANIIIQRTFGDYCAKRQGKWHASAAATRGGPLAVELERMVYREGCPRDEAFTRLQTLHPELTAHDLEAIFDTIPRRPRRATSVSLDAAPMDIPVECDADLLVVEAERRKLSDRAAAVIRRFLDRLDDKDRLLLQTQFESDMQLSQVSRVLQVPQKPLYRRREQLLRDLRAELKAARITREEVTDLIGHLPEDADFGLRKAEIRPTETEDGVDSPTRIRS